MKLHQSNKTWNKRWATAYLVFAFVFVGMGMWNNPLWYLPAVILMGLSAWRLFWLGKRSKE